MTDDYSYLFDYKMRMADLQDIAAMDRMAADLRPQSALSRWAEQRVNLRSARRQSGWVARHRQARHAS
ncbi:hypothetical protein [uncultured Friedmanniella sp.]|uniref:hypothetical protein n=1 Tax=uncultured Friedmanniella sp. TaxID=335381 RepID=UPI0035CBB2C1